MARIVSRSWTGRRSASVERTSTSMNSSGDRPGSRRYVPFGTASILGRKRRLHHRRHRQGVLVTPLPQGPDDLLAPLGGVVLVQLELALDLLDLDAEADDLRQQALHEGTGRVERPGPGPGPLVDPHGPLHNLQQR